MSIDLVIIGAGLTGLFAACLAADAGLSIHLVSYGRGGLSLSHGCIDILDVAAPSRAIKNLPDDHPYKNIPYESIKSSIRAFKDISNRFGLPYSGGLSTSFQLISASGIPFRTSLAPQTLLKGRLDDPRAINIVNVEHFRDFWAPYAASNAKRGAVAIHSTVQLPLMQMAARRDLYATDFERLFADPSLREEIWRAWKPRLAGLKRVGFPAIFGIAEPEALIEEAEQYFGIEIFEIPTLPPSLPGVRLETKLRKHLAESGIPVTEGARAQGRIDGRSKGKRAAGVQIGTAGGTRALDAKSVLLTTGGFLHGGLEADPFGRIMEGVFGIPLDPALPRNLWTTLSYWDPQPYSRFGLKVDRFMRPLDHRGKPFLQNLFAAGGILAGADRTIEGSRQGIDLSTAYHAVQSILATVN